MVRILYLSRVKTELNSSRSIFNSLLRIVYVTRPAPGPPKTPNAFALFVKENYKVHKKPGVQHKDVMTLLSQEFAKVKLKKGN